MHGFESETGELLPHEIKAASIIAQRIRHNTGELNAVTSDQITGRLEREHNIILTGPRLRKVINYIRRLKMVVNLVASSKGYYVETDPVKIRAYVDSLKQRAAAILEMSRSFEIHPPVKQGSLFQQELQS